MDLDVHGGCKEIVTEFRQKAVSGIKWSALSQIGRQGAQLLSTVVLARLLSPSDFGLLGMAMVVIGFVNIFKDLGTSAAIIRQRVPSDALLSSVFWINVCFGAVAMLVLFFIAPLGGLFYREPRVVDILQVLSATFFISGFGILHQSLLERSLSFNLLAKLELAAVIIGAIIGVVLALVNSGVWSLVIQSLVTVTLSTVLLWSSCSWRPRWELRWEEIKSVSRFSINLTGFNIFNYFTRNADYLLIGRFLGAQELGYYTLAYRVLLFPIQNISAVIGRVLYPVLSSAQGDKDRFSRIYLKAVRSIAFITFPLMMGLFALADPFVRTIFGDTWRPVILLIVIFAPVGLIQSVATTVGSIYQAMGKADWMFRWGVASGTLAIIAFIIGLRWGIVGVATSYAISSFILSYPGFFIPFRLIDIKVAQLFREVMPSFLNSVLMVGVLMLFRNMLPVSLPVEFVFILSVAVGVVVYGAASRLTNEAQFKELWDLAGIRARDLHETS